jgi:hypothetical protein
MLAAVADEEKYVPSKPPPTDPSRFRNYKSIRITPTSMWNAVELHGGIKMVLRSRAWQKVRATMNLPAATSSGYYLKHIFDKYFGLPFTKSEQGSRQETRQEIPSLPSAEHITALTPRPTPTQGAKQHPVGNYGTPTGAHGRAGTDHKRKLSNIDCPTDHPTNGDLGDGGFNYGTPTDAHHGHAGAEHKRTVSKTYPKIYYPTVYPTNGGGGFEQSSTFERQTKKRRKSHERTRKSPKNAAPFRQKYENRKKSHARLLSTNNTGYAGVTWRAGNRFQARINFGGKLRSLGTFDTPQEAALAYDRAVIKNRLPVSNLNFPNDYKDRSYLISDLDEEEETMFWAALVQESDAPTEDAFYEHVLPNQEEESRRHVDGGPGNYNVHYDGGDGGHYGDQYGDQYGNMGHDDLYQPMEEDDDLYQPMEEDDDLYLPKNPTPRDYAWSGNRSLKNSSIHEKTAGGKKKKVKAPPKLCLGVSEPGLVGQEVKLGSGYNVKRRFLGKRAMVLGASPISGGECCFCSLFCSFVLY